MIYLKSLIRSSTLCTAVAIYSITEKEFRQLERIEEEILRNIFKTRQGYPIYQSYFESGILPARYQIKRKKVVFYQYILNQKENSLPYTFLKAQQDSPKREDWYPEVQSILKEFEIKFSENKIKETPPHGFKTLVKKCHQRWYKLFEFSTN